jgi:uncharacterized membrane protein
MASEKFRHQLMKEAQKWQEENLIDSSLYEQLSSRYQFDQLANIARNRFIVVLISIGSILLGLAVITLVAANWQYLTREIKVTLLLGLFLIVNITAFYLWKNTTSGWRHRLGLGLFSLGGLVFGANLGLMSQLFHQSGEIYQLFLIWGIGIITMAFGLRITSLSIMGIILLAIAYLSGYYYVFDLGNQDLIFKVLIEHFPVIIGGTLMALAYLCESPWLFGLTVCLIMGSFLINISGQLHLFFWFSPLLGGITWAIAYCFTPAFFYGYNDNLWGINSAKSQLFSRISRSLSLVLMGGIFYSFSFRYLWEYGFDPRYVNFTRNYFFNLIDPLILVILTLLAWWRLGLNNEQKTWKIDLNATAIATLLIITSICLIIQITFMPLGWIGIFIFNVILALFAIGLIRESLGSGKRGGFWFGISLIVLQIFSRTLEYDTSLLLKAFVFFLCGVGIITAGLWFEKYVKNLNSDVMENRKS